MRQTNKNPLAVIMLVLLLSSLFGCVDLNVKPVDISVELRNATEYEITGVVFDIPAPGGGSPMVDILNSEEEPIKPHSERTVAFTVSQSQNRTGGGVGVAVYILGQEGPYELHGDLDFKGEKKYEITCSDDMVFFWGVTTEEG